MSPASPDSPDSTAVDHQPAIVRPKNPILLKSQTSTTTKYFSDNNSFTHLSRSTTPTNHHPQPSFPLSQHRHKTSKPPHSFIHPFIHSSIHSSLDSRLLSLLRSSILLLYIPAGTSSPLYGVETICRTQAVSPSPQLSITYLLVQRTTNDRTNIITSISYTPRQLLVFLPN